MSAPTIKELEELFSEKGEERMMEDKVEFKEQQVLKEQECNSEQDFCQDFCFEEIKMVDNYTPFDAIKMQREEVFNSGDTTTTRVARKITTYLNCGLSTQQASELVALQLTQEHEMELAKLQIENEQAIADKQIELSKFTAQVKQLLGE